MMKKNFVRIVALFMAGLLALGTVAGVIAILV
jgi:hypothetical protein